MVFDVVQFGMLAVMVAVAVLLALIHYELGPLSRLAGHRRWLLATALGSGILAFTLKLLLIVTMDRFPQWLIEPLPVTSPLARTPAAPPPVTPPRYRREQLPAEHPPRPSSGNQHYVWETLPAQAPAPAGNPTTPAKVALGERLFHDRTLSRDGTLSCASCHDIHQRAGIDGRRTALGIAGQQGGRNTPTVWNAAFQSVLFWDGRAASLEEQAQGPMTNPLEMGMPSLLAVEERVQQNPEYGAAFDLAFGTAAPITIERISKAIAAYERTLITTDTPYDRFVSGDTGALSPAQLRGMALFQSAGCISCHYGPNFSAASLFDGRQPLRSFPATPIAEETRYDLTRDTGAAAAHTGRGVWRIPSLRNVALTGPWFHNGQVKELAEAVRIMARAQLDYGGHYLLWSERERVLREQHRPTLSEQEVNDIVAFLNALSSDALAAAMTRQQIERERVAQR
jgi:cytochrome c peroxidase